MDTVFDVYYNTSRLKSPNSYVEYMQAIPLTLAQILESCSVFSVKRLKAVEWVREGSPAA